MIKHLKSLFWFLSGVLIRMLSWKPKKEGNTNYARLGW